MDAAFIMLLTKEHNLFPLIESFIGIVTFVYKYESEIKKKKRKL